ncbi:MAG TPA: hypothetical protein VFR85_15660 [Anaeromyxobacteraceae bacterium]|nr:hypothetical protein [Anaeromyxobacteraceae bacterium]
MTEPEEPTNGASRSATDDVAQPELRVGDLLEAVTRAAADKAPGTTPEQLAAWATLLTGILSTPAVSTAFSAWGAAKQAEANAKVELAKQQGKNADEARKRQSEIARWFLVSLAVVGVAGMGFLAFIAKLDVLDKQAFAVLTTSFFTALFGTGIFGTVLRTRKP